jgi:alpha-N-acetylglucosaminidase
MGNIKRYGGGLTPAWHSDQVELQKKILNRYSELGIVYVLPAFSGFVPDAFRRYIFTIFWFVFSVF